MKYRKAFYSSLLFLLLTSCSTPSNNLSNQSKNTSQSESGQHSSSQSEESTTSESEQSSINVTTYTITWKNYDGTILEVDTQVPQGTMPSYDGAVPTRPNIDEYEYTWTGWTPEISVVTEDQIYTATYSYVIREYTVTFDSHGGSEVPSQKIVRGGKVTKPEDPTRLGYEFVNWTYKGEEWSFIGYSVTEDMTLDANWDVVTYSVTYNFNGGEEVSNPSTYTIEDNVALSPSTRFGYTFDGWFDDENNQITHLGQTIVGNFTLTARWSANLNNLSIASSDETKGTVAIVSGSGYSDETITVVATPADECVFKGWYHESTKVSNDATYTFTMPTNDYSLIAYFTTIEEEERRLGVVPTLSNDGKTITYGLYPQKNINNPSLINVLNTLTTPESNGWYLYGGDYYAKLSATPYHSSYKFDNGTTIVRGTTYWFKCEPITWNILSNNAGQYYIVSSVLLDTHCYYISMSTRTIDGQTIYPNNYEYSDIRTWLNDDFYNSAFALGNEHILTTTVDNSASTTDSDSNSYACNNTQDKIFLPSYKDYINSNYGFSTYTNSDNARYCRTTDWVRARGAWYYTSSDDSYQFNGYYWTRSPTFDRSHRAWDVHDDGSLSFDSVNYTINTVRPAITITIA